MKRLLALLVVLLGTPLRSLLADPLPDPGAPPEPRLPLQITYTLKDPTDRKDKADPAKWTRLAYVEGTDWKPAASVADLERAMNEAKAKQIWFRFRMTTTKEVFNNTFCASKHDGIVELWNEGERNRWNIRSDGTRWTRFFSYIFRRDKIDHPTQYGANYRLTNDGPAQLDFAFVQAKPYHVPELRDAGTKSSRFQLVLDIPHIRDACAIRGPDGKYYIVGTPKLHGTQEGIDLFRADSRRGPFTHVAIIECALSRGHSRGAQLRERRGRACRQRRQTASRRGGPRHDLSEIDHPRRGHGHRREFHARSDCNPDVERATRLARRVRRTTDRRAEQERAAEERSHRVVHLSGNTMSKQTYFGIEHHVGHTPLIRLRRLSELTGCEILGKAEFMNPGGSVKDRAALRIIQDGEERGALKPGGTIVEGTAGNTGIGLTLLGQARGYRTIIIIPETQSPEKLALLRALGAEVRPVPVKPFTDPANYNRQAQSLALEHGWFWANQFDNTANLEAHYRTTGPEIWEQTRGQITALVSAIGSGGTLAGTTRFLKERNPRVASVLADPMGAAMWSWFTHGHTEIKDGDSVAEGIGQSRVTKNIEGLRCDAAYRVPDQTALTIIHRLLREEGLYLGLSSGINIGGAVRHALAHGPGQTIVTFLCDTGHKYQSKIYNREWLAANQLDPDRPLDSILERHQP